MIALIKFLFLFHYFLFKVWTLRDVRDQLEDITWSLDQLLACILEVLLSWMPIMLLIRSPGVLKWGFLFCICIASSLICDFYICWNLKVKTSQSWELSINQIYVHVNSTIIIAYHLNKQIFNSIRLCHSS